MGIKKSPEGLMNYFNPVLLHHHDESSRSFSHNFCFLSQAHQDNTILYLF